MKFNRARPSKRPDGYFLVEVLVYIVVLVIVWEVAFGVYEHCEIASLRLQRNAADILHAVDAGERWREDIRLARKVSIAGDSLQIVQNDGTVVYSLATNTIWRSKDGSNTVALMRDVKTSVMTPDTRQRAAAWKWELELQSAPRRAKAEYPLFTFEAVPAISIAK